MVLNDIDTDFIRDSALKRRRVDSNSSSTHTQEDEKIFCMHVASPFDSSKYTVGFSNHDKCMKGNVLQAPEYVCDIFQRLSKIEVSRHCIPVLHNYLVGHLMVDKIAGKVISAVSIDGYATRTKSNDAHDCH